MASEGFMEICGINRCGHMEVALKKAGLKIEEIVMLDKKTVITVSLCEQHENQLSKTSLRNKQIHNPKNAEQN